MLPSRLVLQSGRILLRVDTRGARYPLRIDPMVQQAELTGGGEEQGEEGRLGASVALSADGHTALIGAPNDDNGAGAAWVFTRSIRAPPGRSRVRSSPGAKRWAPPRNCAKKNQN